MINLEKNYVASYCISLEDVGMGRLVTRYTLYFAQVDLHSPPPVMAIEESPRSENVILIAYESSHIIEWEITTRKVKNTYGPLKQVSSCWT